MPSIRVDFKHVRANASFEKVAAHYNMTLTGKGDQRAALCIFHEDDTPSLKINLAKNIFNCFGCGAHGNVLDFVTLMDGGNPDNEADIRKGALLLAEICGIEPMPRHRPPQKHEKIGKPIGPMARRTRPAAQANSYVVPPEAEPRINKPLSFVLKLDATHPYLTERRLSKETIETFGLGVADRGLMKGRLAIPIHNENGALIAYAGRWAATELPKNTPKYLLPEGFAKQVVLFNLHRVHSDCEQVVLVESFFSVFKLHELGVPVVSSMGRALSERHCELLKARGVERVVLLFDGIDASDEGLAIGVKILAKYFYVYAPIVAGDFKPHRAQNAELLELIGA
jgi:DNA primase